MNPQERAVIDGIFERLKAVANQPRDAEVEHYIVGLIQQQPYAPYAMAQSVYVQEQALINQQGEIERLQAENTRLQQQAAAAPAVQPQGGFLSGLFGGGAATPRQGEPPAYGQRGQGGSLPGMAPQQQGYAPQMAAQPPQGGPWAQPQQPPQKQGMGFLGTAAAAAAGVAGGMMLGNVLSSAFGGGGAHAQTPPQPNHAMSPPAQQPDNSYGAEPEVDDDEGYSDDDFGSGGDDSYEA